MIRINLLGGVKPEFEEKPSALPPTTVFRVKVLALSLLGGLAVVWGLRWYWNRQIAELDIKLAAERREAARLAAMQVENQRYQQQLLEIRDRINAINTLMDSRKEPVALMTLLGDSVNRTSGVYLISVGSKSGRLELEGQSNSVSSIADFISTLQRAGSFQDIQLRQYFENDLDNEIDFKFDLNCIYSSPPTAAQVTASSASAPAKALPARM